MARYLFPIGFAFLVGILIVGIYTSAGSDQKWGWFAAMSVINKWAVAEGEAQVQISKDRFFAELYDKNAFLTITLRGVVRGASIEAIAEQHATDDEPRKLRGILKKIRWKAGGGRESIVLTEPNAPWGLTIGLTREIPGR